MHINEHILVDEKHPATIRYIGSVDGHSGQWIGIEWWSNQHGKHNGTYQGKFYFQTKYSTNGSFIRQERIHHGYSFTQAVHRQYIKAFSNETLTPIIDYSIFGKQYSDYALDLSSLLRIDLSSQWINQFDDNQQIYDNLRQIKELNIRQNLLENWSQLWIELERSFPHIQILNVSNSRMNLDRLPTNKFDSIEEFVLIDTEYDCQIIEDIIEYFPSLTNLHLDLNCLTFISQIFVNRLNNLIYLSLSDNPTLKHWNPFINYLGQLQHLQELVLNNCGIDQIDIQDFNSLSKHEMTKYFPSLKYLFMSDNKISSYQSINQLSCLSSLISFSILRNPIYSSNHTQIETDKQMIIARLPNLIYLNRVFISRDERRGAEIDYLQCFAQQYYDQTLDFINEHRNYQHLIEKYGEPIKQNINHTTKKGLCIRPSLLKVIFEFDDVNIKKIEKKIPLSMSVSKLKIFVRRLFPLELNNNTEINLFIVIDSNNKELMSNDYQDIQFYLGNDLLNSSDDRPSIIKIEKLQ